QDLEGELGIDTVKQAEIMAELREFYGLPVDESFVLSEHPTLNHMIAYLGQDQPSELSSSPEVAPSEPPQQPEPSPTAPTASSVDLTGVRRWQVEVEESPAEPAPPLEIQGKVIAVTDDPWGVADTLCHILEAADIDTVRIMLDPSIVSKIKVEVDGPVDIIRVNPNNRAQLSEVSHHLANVGEVVALLHLAPLHLAGVGWESETQAAHLASTTHGLFGLLKSLDSHFSSLSDGTVMSVTAMDGRHGNVSDRFNALAAGAHGIVKSYAKEQPHLRSRAVDVDPDMLEDPTALAHQIWAEAFGRTSPLEVGLARDGSRWSMRLYEEDLVMDRTPLLNDDVWVVSGGGSGVTARCIIGIAEASKDADATFILLGRTRLDASIEEWLYDEEEAIQARKVALRERLIESSENGKVTMVEWDREWNKKMRNLDIHRTLHAIRATGNRALYEACDVTKTKSVTKVFNAILKEYNSITGLIHGAGMEDSKLVSDKSWDTFSDVVSIKIDGWRAMIDALEGRINDLRVVCAFTSVAGRFGNGGQVDYAAANNILDAEMCRIAHHEDAPRAIAIAWSGWKGVGMATRGSIESVFAQAGIEMIPVETGVDLFVDEMLAGGKRRVVAAGSLGILDDESSKRDPPQKLPEDTTGLLAEPERFPFVERVLNHEPYVQISTECTLDVSRFPFLIDHAIDGTPYHPGVMAMEMFSEAALLLYPMCTMVGFYDVHFGLPVKLVKDEVKIRVRAEFSEQNSSEIYVNCVLESDLVNSKGEIFGEPRIHHSATVRLLKDGAVQEPELPFNSPPGRSKASFQPSFIYQRFFHGPRFQVLGGLVKGVRDGEDIGADGIALLRSQLPNPHLFSGDENSTPTLLESLPMLVEACFQNAGLVAMEVDGLSSLPVGIESVEILKSPSARDNLRVRSFRRGIEEDGITRHDAIIFDGNQKPLVILTGLRLKGMAPVPDDLRFELQRKSN
ncbi:MAG: SDR family oxidoreductase, partial [Candidatus Thermoplasmatota archaeon]|nr:SDR family oxidoreductase [Candidatus Thermoplasmatota archaeon]